MIEREHLTDVLDIATDLTMRENEFLIKDSSLRVAPRQVQVADDFGNPYWRVTECDMCGEELEPHRLPMCRCVPCQQQVEACEKSYAHH